MYLTNVLCGAQTHTYPEQDHLGGVLEDLCEGVRLRLLGGVGWVEGDRLQVNVCLSRLDGASVAEQQTLSCRNVPDKELHPAHVINQTIRHLFSDCC